MKSWHSGKVFEDRDAYLCLILQANYSYHCWMRITASSISGQCSDRFCFPAHGRAAVLFLLKEGYCLQVWNNIAFSLGMPPTQMMADWVLVVWSSSWERLCPFHDNIWKHGEHTNAREVSVKSVLELSVFTALLSHSSVLWSLSMKWGHCFSKTLGE